MMSEVNTISFTNNDMSFYVFYIICVCICPCYDHPQTWPIDLTFRIKTQSTSKCNVADGRLDFAIIQSQHKLSKITC